MAACLGVLTLGQNDKFQNQLSPFNPGKSWEKNISTCSVSPLRTSTDPDIYRWGEMNKSLPQTARQTTPTTIRISNGLHLFGICGVRRQKWATRWAYTFTQQRDAPSVTLPMCIDRVFIARREATLLEIWNHRFEKYYSENHSWNYTINKCTQ